MRLHSFTLSVGNIRDNYSQCASHKSSVAASGSVEETCTAIGRYLLFRRDGGIDPHLAGLCEVVVIGHLFVGENACVWSMSLMRIR